MLDYIAANFWPLFAAAVIGAGIMYLFRGANDTCGEAIADDAVKLLGDNARLQHDNRRLRNPQEIDATLLARVRPQPPVELAGPDGKEMSA